MNVHVGFGIRSLRLGFATALTVSVSALLLGGCVMPHASTETTLSFGGLVPASAVTVADADVPQDAKAAPPCRHPGDMPSAINGERLERCSTKNPTHVAYWAAKPDKLKLACKNEAPGYCNPSSGMVPHCHGWGEWRFCHAHPGGAYAHNHIQDGEFATTTVAALKP